MSTPRKAYANETPPSTPGMSSYPFSNGSSPGSPSPSRKDRHRARRPSLHVHSAASAFFAQEAELEFESSGSASPPSPKRGRTKRSSRSSGRRLSLSLNSPTRPKRTWRQPRMKTATKRACVLLLLFTMVCLLSKLQPPRKPNSQPTLLSLPASNIQRLRRWTSKFFQSGFEGRCRFESTVEAYHRDLERLRGMYPSSSLASFDRASQDHHSHVFSETGHLLVSPDHSQPHPIPLLLERGEKQWKELLSRQSRTLEDAVKEYTKRYSRPPPKGFDKWWEFAMANDLLLPDEYDRINLDLAPFFALPKEEMRRRLEMVEEMDDTFTVIVKNGEVSAEVDETGLEYGGTWPRAKAAASMLDTFAKHLPDMRATFSVFDQPQVYLSWARRESLIKLGLNGEHTSHLEETDDARVRLSRSCHPDTNLRRNISAPEGRSFIYDTLAAYDICQNPDIVPLHGLTIEPHGPDSEPRPHTQLLPLFSLAKTSINSDILTIPLDQFFDGTGNDPAWEDKPSSKLAWRGSTTGISVMNKQLDWRSSHRIRAHTMANPLEGVNEQVSYLVPDVGQDQDHDKDNDLAAEETTTGDVPVRASVEEATLGETVDFFFDVKLAGGPLQCDEEDGTCDDLRYEIDFAEFQHSPDLNQHKFLLDIDGNGWSGRFRRLMLTNSLVIKASIFTEWFQPHLIPWFMFVPSKLDYTDLTDILAFFRGTPKHPDLAFDETARAIAKNGQCFAKRMFRLEDVQAYMWRLFLEYSRLVADEGEDMNFYLAEELEQLKYGSVSQKDPTFFDYDKIGLPRPDDFEEYEDEETEGWARLVDVAEVVEAVGVRENGALKV